MVFDSFVSGWEWRMMEKFFRRRPTCMNSVGVHLNTIYINLLVCTKKLMCLTENVFIVYI